MRWARGLPAITGLSLFVAACADLTPMAQGICGNEVIDADEDCDGHDGGPNTSCADPGSAHACRYVCGDLSVCPTGWGCGADGVCRRASGSFAPLDELVAFPSPSRLQSGDFDGDGRPDVLLLGQEDTLGRSAARLIHAPTDDGLRVESLPLHIAAPALGELEDDDELDLAFADRGGVALRRGERGRAEFIAFPSLLLPPGSRLRAMPMEVIPGEAGDELVTFVERLGSGAALERPAGALPAAVLTALPGGEADLAGPIGWGRFDELLPCTQLVLAYRGANEVLLFSPCRADDVTGVSWNVGGTTTPITLPPGASVDHGVLVADMDFDGHLDLLIGASNSAFVAWGRGNGAFVAMQSKDGGASPLGAGPYPLPDAAGADGNFPLAVGDLNADGVMDFVGPRSVACSHKHVHTISFLNAGAAWEHAVIADLNADGRADVAAGSSQTLDIDFLNNAGGCLLNPSTIPTSGPTTHFATGDFDGDLLQDLAFSEIVVEDGGDADHVSIAFGASHGPPTAVTTMAHVRPVTQLAPAHFLDPSNTDAVSDLVAVSDDAASGTEHLASFRGAGSRLLLASSPLRDQGRTAFPLALAIGRFEGATRAIAAVAVNSDDSRLRLWRVGGADASTADAVAPSEPLSAAFHHADDVEPSSFLYGALAAAGDLDGDGVDELVVAAPYGQALAGAALLVADYEPAVSSFVARPERPFTAVLSERASLQLRDVDGGGRLDALLVTGSHQQPGELMVIWNDGHGGLATDTPTRLVIDGGVRGVDCLPRPAGGCDLVVASDSGVYRGTITDERVDLTLLEGMPGARDVVSGDFDGDGVIDLAVATFEGVQFYRSIPVLP